ncbi:hypothetical protein [Pseudomonas petrae]|uniref:hypothetical protein n=1 Tax=Pseudomonas petrae TaxID=2912190 RepID=UPI001F28031E|nr:hypothetical protein [Pseudomonas petrae]MCF7536176.1 hypothetical protein [Pseudomonas petrae]
MTIEKMREEFEAWECEADTGPLTDPMWLMRDPDQPDSYGIVQVQRNWDAWQASRAALVIELPKPESDEGESWDGCWKYGIKQCREAIEAAGLKVNP